MSSITTKVLLFVIGSACLKIAIGKTMQSSLFLSSGAKEESPPDFPKTNNPHILVAGGAGYIASHTILCLLKQGYDVTVVDNLINSSMECLNRVKELAGCEDARLRYYDVDMAHKASLERVFKTSPKFSACIQFAGLKAVGESVEKPLLYYENNLISTFNLLRMMERCVDMSDI